MTRAAAQPDPALSGLLSAVLAAGDGPGILAALEAGLGPCRLWLHDQDAGILYLPEGEAPDRPSAELLAAPPPGLHPCRAGSAVVAVLESDHAMAPWAAAAVGPALVGQRVQELALERVRLAEDKARLITEAGALLREFDIERVLVLSLQAVLHVLGSEIGALLACEEGGLALRTAWGLDGEHLRQLRLADGRWLPEAVLAEDRLRSWDAAALRGELDPAAGAGVRLEGLIALPLTVAGRRHGVILAVNTGACTARDCELVGTIGGIAAIAIDNARLVASGLERERLRSTLAVARQVQQGIFPRGPLAWQGAEVAGAVRPCDETGGDYCQYAVVGGHLAALIGDVSGHGLGAALYTTMAHAGLMQALRGGAGPAAACAAVAEGLAASAVDDTYMTAVVALYDPARGRLRWCSAGHPSGLLLGRDGGLRRLGSTGPPLGMFPELGYVEEELPFAAGDLLLLFTDGISEMWDRSGGQYGEARLEQALRRLAHESPGRIVEAVLDEVQAFAGGEPARDDLTLLALRAS